MTEADETEEWEADDDVFDGTCDHCGRARPVRLDVDPFLEEVYGERTEESAWCLSCWDARKDDI